MAKFIIDITNSLKHAESLNTKIIDYDLKSDETYMNVKNTTNNWVEPASQLFEKIVAKNEQTSDDIINSIKQYIKNIKYFSNSLKNILNNHDYNDDLKLKYDSLYLLEAHNNSSSVESTLKDIVSLYDSLTVPSDCEVLNSINLSYNKINSCLNTMNGIKNDLYDIRTKTENLLVEVESNHQGIELIYEDRKVTSFVSNIVTPEIPSNGDLISLTGGSQAGNVISAQSEQIINEDNVE